MHQVRSTRRLFRDWISQATSSASARMRPGHASAGQQRRLRVALVRYSMIASDCVMHVFAVAQQRHRRVADTAA